MKKKVGFLFALLIVGFVLLPKEAKAGDDHTHTWKNPVWTWAEDYSTASVTLTCSGCHETKTMEATVTKREIMPALCTQEGKVQYTASVKDGDGQWVDWKIVTVPKTAHSFANPQWTWAEDYSTASVTLTCKVCGEPKTMDATITKREIMPALCTQEGKVQYTASVKDGDGQWVDWKKVTIPKTAHTFENPVWTWTETDDGYKASVTLTCSFCGAEEIFEAEVTSEVTKQPTCTEEGEITYTASYALDENTVFTDTKTDPIPATGHDWSDPVWTWNQDNTQAAATFTCQNPAAEVEKVTAVITSKEENGKILYTAKVVFNGKTYTDQKSVDKPAAPVSPEKPDSAVTGNGSQNTSTNPKTGDSSQLMLWVITLGAAFILLMVEERKRATVKQKEENR